MSAFSFVHGADDFLVTRLGKSLFEEAAKGIDDDFAKEVIHGDAGTVDEAVATISSFRTAANTLPMFGDRKVIWLRDVTFLSDTPAGRSETTLEQVELMRETLEKLDPANIRVIITALRVDNRRAFPKWCKKHGDFHAVGGDGRDKDNTGQLRELVEAECRASSISISAVALQTLVEKLSGNSRLVIEEVRKLSTYLDEGAKIEEKHVVSLVPAFDEGDIFELADAFDRRDLPGCLAAIRRYFFIYNEARPLISGLQNRNRLLIQLRALMDGKQLSGGVSKAKLDQLWERFSEHFGNDRSKSNLNVCTQHPFYLGKLMRTAGGSSLKELIRHQEEFIRTFREIIGRPTEQEACMRDLVVRCLG